MIYAGTRVEDVSENTVSQTYLVLSEVAFLEITVSHDLLNGKEVRYLELGIQRLLKTVGIKIGVGVPMLNYSVNEARSLKLG